MNKAVFIDKDGTLIPDIPYNVDPEKITLQANTAEGLRQLQNLGFLLIIISNQAGVARGYFKEDAIGDVQKKIEELLHNEGLKLDGFYYCPHHPEGTVAPYAVDCTCRKPKAGMFIKAALDFDVELSESWMIGDILHDVEAGNSAGCRSILIDNGNETEWEINAFRKPDYLARNINEAANYIIQNTPSIINYE
ncbi:HAD-IIIA family hydrolase [Pedobacter sp. SYSU D00535]|uniref:D-glycero-alpha-D-manno-heptose-1,7-bisphosphate 7-phosphatase n=1 Tax=Pedobacter sp. SYSU D00535 TaxID=2810308 RepID=UPI001A956736|nr:HAD family hydrolase [Pedobacter sp. SYSU D00535]